MGHSDNPDPEQPRERRKFRGTWKQFKEQSQQADQTLLEILIKEDDLLRAQGFELVHIIHDEYEMRRIIKKDDDEYPRTV